MSKVSAPLRVLIVRIGAMGDVLHAMPAVAGLRAAMPGCFIGWAVEPRWMPLLRAESETGEGEMPLVDRVHAVATKQWKRRVFSAETVREIAQLGREMRAERYDVCVDVQGSVKSAVVGWMSGARRLVGSAAPREWPAGFLYDSQVRLKDKNVIAQACELVGAAVGLWEWDSERMHFPSAAYRGAEELHPGRVLLPMEDVAEQWAEFVRPRGKFAMIAPTAGWGAKEWGAERFAELARRLQDAGVRVVVNKATGSGVGVAEEIAATSGSVVVESTVGQMVALTRRAALVVGGDTGPMHLAAALGRPLVALYGPTDPARNGPDFPAARVRVLRDAGSVTDHRRDKATEAGLGRIRVEEVLAACLEILGSA